MKIRSARSEDLDAIAALLAENELPASDVTPNLLRDFAVAEDAHGSVVGSVGLERFGAEALLRSLAVEGPERKTGLGSKLLARAEETARASGISELWLLTTTAADFFRGLAIYPFLARAPRPHFRPARSSPSFVQVPRSA